MIADVILGNKTIVYQPAHSDLKVIILSKPANKDSCGCSVIIFSAGATSSSLLSLHSSWLSSLDNGGSGVLDVLL